ncbi:hypothetical protein PVK06_027249 [Gossypium arboreum]|uniref:Uncharacterized protein n=1 Tax=Gossypium arboreum TaxID=29729 RepID=A0ABR0P2P6_GOSAR|nr:hypothetical protein PVK06_027249 [Gossypium arboreum]
MPRKRTCACAQIDETQNKFHCEEAKARYESIFKNQQMHPEKGFTLKESNYKDFMVRICQVAENLNWELFCEKRPSVDKELVHEFYANLTSRELTEVPVRGIKVPITSKAINEFFALLDFKNDEYSYLMNNIKPEICKKFSKNLQFQVLSELFQTYSQGTITDWDLYQITGDSVLQLRIEESEDPEEEEEDPIEIERMQSAEVPDKVEPMEPKVEPDDKTSIVRAQ